MIRENQKEVGLLEFSVLYYRTRHDQQKFCNEFMAKIQKSIHEKFYDLWIGYIDIYLKPSLQM